MQKFLFMLLSLVLLGPLGIDLYLPTIPAIAVGLGSSEALIQSTISLFILVLGLGQVIAGPLVDNYGRKPVALAGIILYMIGAAMAALATSPTIFIASRLLQRGGGLLHRRRRLQRRARSPEWRRCRPRFRLSQRHAEHHPCAGAAARRPARRSLRLARPFWFLVGYALLVLVLIALRLPETRPADTVPVKGCRCANTRASSAIAVSSPLRW